MSSPKLTCPNRRESRSVGLRGACLDGTSPVSGQSTADRCCGRTTLKAEHNCSASKPRGALFGLNPLDAPEPTDARWIHTGRGNAA